MIAAHQDREREQRGADRQDEQRSACARDRPSGGCSGVVSVSMVPTSVLMRPSSAGGPGGDRNAGAGAAATKVPEKAIDSGRRAARRRRPARSPLSTGTDSPVSAASSMRRLRVRIRRRSAGTRSPGSSRHEVAGNDVLRRNGRPPAIAQHGGARVDHPSDGVERAARSAPNGRKARVAPPGPKADRSGRLPARPPPNPASGRHG